MERETHVQTVVVSTGTCICFVMVGLLPCFLAFCHSCRGFFHSITMSTSQLAACRTGDFWIQCDFCDTWYDGKCVQVRHFCLKSILLHLVCPMRPTKVVLQMTPGKAQRMGKWKCPACERRMG